MKSYPPFFGDMILLFDREFDLLQIVWLRESFARTSVHPPIYHCINQICE